MNRLLAFGLALAGICSAGRAATLPIFINDGPIILPDAGLPTINAQAFVNQSTFQVNSFVVGVGLGSGNFLAGSSAASLPYETFNTRYYTNDFTGVMSGNAGFRFLTTQGRTRVPALWFVNYGSIAGGGFVEVRADNIISEGPLDTSQVGLVRLLGKNVDATRSRLRTGQFVGSGGGLGYNDDQRRQYSQEFGVYDSYWGIGSNGVFLGNGPSTRLNTINLNLPSLFSPLHQNQLYVARRLATNRVSLPKVVSFSTNFFDTNFSAFAAFAYTNTVDGTAAMVQVVFVRTNSPDGNLSADVRFAPFPSGWEVEGPATAMVELRTWNFDPSLDAFITNTFYVADHMAVRTNLSLYRPAPPGPNTRRPSNYEFTLGPPLDWFFSDTNNTPFYNGLLDTGYLSNRVDMLYSGYRADVFTNIWGVLSNPFLSSRATIRPTNLAGRVEVVADRLNLDSTRIRSESTVLIRTKDLVSNSLPQLVDAPLVGYDIGSRLPEMVISNIALREVTRLSGAVCAWSGQWRNRQVDTNTMTTNEINFHVLIVDHAFTNRVPVNVFEFQVKATNIVIADHVNLFPTTNQFGFISFSDPVRGRKFKIDATSLDVRGGLSLPLGSSWARTNILNLVNLTNSGIIDVPGSAKYGTDRPEPYNSIINYGTNSAASQLVRTRLFENSGSFVGDLSLVQISADEARIHGPPLMAVTNIFPVGTNTFFTNIFYTSLGAIVASVSDLQISAGTLTVSNSYVAAGGADINFVYPGRLILSVTNFLTDFGPQAPNNWNCSGFELRRQPTQSGDLLGTRLASLVAVNQLKNHIWAASDLGPVAEGFTNNLALGGLSLGMSINNSRAVFRSASGRQAIYVDYLELYDGATNFNRTITIDPNFTIYFANANVPVSKLDGANNGRFQWVSSFAGPNSSTNITYPSGNTYTFNIALVQNTDLDSDGDGVPNADDPTPIYVPDDATLAVALLEKVSPPRAMLSWKALAFSTNTVEFKNLPSDPQWRVLTNFVHGPFTAPVQIFDPVTGTPPTRVYRLRVNPTANP